MILNNAIVGLSDVRFNQTNSNLDRLSISKHEEKKMKNKQTPDDFNISANNTESNLFTTFSSRTFTMFLLALTLCISGFTITAAAQQDGRRLQNSGDIASKNDSSEIPANSQPDSPEGVEDVISDGGFESSTGQYPKCSK